MNTPQSLADLVQDASRRHGLDGRPASGLELSKKAKSKGFRLTYTTVNHIKAGTYKSVPKAETIRALAWLAGVSEEVAFTAAGQPVPGPPLADELPDGADHLSPKSRRVIIDMVRVLIDLETTHDKHTPAHQDGHTPTDDGRPAGRELRRQDEGPNAGPGEKTTGRPSGAGLDQIDFDLAAHPDMPLERDRFDAEHGDAGEENQDRWPDA